MGAIQGARSGFFQVGDVRLEYLEWGGNGPALIFLAGYANTPHFFDALAARFTDRCRVLGLCRRAHGLSDQPSEGYDLATRASDVLALMDHVCVDRAVLVGHSFAGGEMTYLGTRTPDRVAGLVYLDALYEYEPGDADVFRGNPLACAAPPAESFESVAAYCLDFVHRYPAYRPLRSPKWDELWARSLTRRADGRYVEKIRPETARLLGAEDDTLKPDLADIRCPVLAIYAYQSASWILPPDAPAELRQRTQTYLGRINREVKDRNVARARAKIADARVVALLDTSHYCFLDREEETAGEISRFLVSLT